MKYNVSEAIHHATVGILLVVNTFCVKYMLIALSEPEMRYVAGLSVLDYYQKFRGTVLFVACVILLLNMLVGILSHRVALRYGRGQVLMAAFMAVVGTSYLFSPYKATADEGFMETYEGVSVLLSYGVLALTTSVMPMTKQILRYYTAIFLGCLGTVTVISILQYFGNDPLRWPVVKTWATSAFLPSDPPDNGYGLAGHGFFGNPNYLSSYFSLFLPFVYFLFLRQNRGAGIVLMALCVAAVNFGVLTSGTLSALMVVVMGTTIAYRAVSGRISRTTELLWHLCLLGPVLFFACWGQDSGFAREAGFSAAAYVFLAGAARFIPSIRSTARRGYAMLLMLLLIPAVILTLLPSRSSEKGLTYIAETNGTLELTVDGRDYAVSAKTQGVEITNRSLPVGKNAPFTMVRTPAETEAAVYTLMPFGIRFDAANDRLRFLNSGRKVDSISQPVFWGPVGYGDLGNGRMYLWQHALPVIGEYPLFGTGPDTFGLVFPQNDMVSKVRYVGNPYALATKAHNIYLNYAVNLGVVGLAVYTALQWVMIYGMARLRNTDRGNPYVEPILLGLVLYSVVGMVNDSRIFIAVYQWTLSGIAISLIGNWKDTSNRITEP